MSLKKISSAFLATAVSVVLAGLPVYASEVSGSLTTGLGNGVQGTVIVTPTASPDAGTYTAAQSITLSAAGALTIAYTTNGSDPSCPGTYSSALSVGSSQTIKAKSCYANNQSSSIASFLYTINIPAPVVVPSGGGGGGGGSGYSYTPPASTSTSGSSGSIQDQLNALLARLAELQRQANSPSPSSTTCVFTRNLTVGSRGEDVRQLQVFLNGHGAQIAASGSGSPGNETTYFGPATRDALASYQASVGISPAAGYFGTLTRARICSALGSGTPASSGGTQTPPAPSSGTIPPGAIPPEGTFTHGLNLGSQDPDVLALQNLLTYLGLYSGPATGYFGSLTQAAVKAFQEKYGIASPGDVGYGYVGPGTRAKLNAILSG